MNISELRAAAAKAGMAKFMLKDAIVPRDHMYVIGADFLDRLLAALLSAAPVAGGEREAFEAWAQPHKLSLARLGEGYLTASADYCWIGYQVHAALLDPAAPAVVLADERIAQLEQEHAEDLSDAGLEAWLDDARADTERRLAANQAAPGSAP